MSAGRGEPIPSLRRLRLRKAWTQGELAQAAGLQRNTIARLEAVPTKAADMRTIRKLAAALGVEPAELLRPVG